MESKDKLIPKIFLSFISFWVFLLLSLFMLGNIDLIVVGIIFSVLNAVIGCAILADRLNL